MRFQLARLRRNRKALVAGTVVLALLIVAPAALSKPGPSQSGVVLQVVMPDVTVAATDNSAAEPGANTGAFTISRTGATTDPLTVNYSVTGTASSGSDYTALLTSVVIPAGQSSVAVVVTPLDDTTHEDDETVILTVTSGTGYAVGSPSGATVTISDNDLPAVSVTASDANASEAGSNTGTFTVARTGSTTSALTVSYTLTGTAANGTDYSSLITSVIIPVGQPSATVTVTPTNDGLAEAAETVILTISANALYTVGSPAAATVTITDDDLPTVTIDATDDSAAEAGSATGTFTVTRTGDTTAALTVNYTISGSAANGTDYASLSGSVTIAAGATSATVVVTPIDDLIDENNETVVLTLAAGAGYQIGGANNDTVTIADNDNPAAAATVTIDATDDSAAEAGSATGTFTVTRTGDTTAALTVNYTISGSAANGTDYASLSGSVTIAAGATSATVVVTPIDDLIDENNETVVLTLAAGAGYQIGGANNDTVTIADNDGAATPPGNRPTDKDQCKKGGWKTFGVFKNQGDCVSWFATGGKNPPAG